MLGGAAIALGIGPRSSLLLVLPILSISQIGFTHLVTLYPVAAAVGCSAVVAYASS